MGKVSKKEGTPSRGRGRPRKDTVVAGPGPSTSKPKVAKPKQKKAVKPKKAKAASAKKSPSAAAVKKSPPATAKKSPSPRKAATPKPPPKPPAPKKPAATKRKAPVPVQESVPTRRSRRVTTVTSTTASNPFSVPIQDRPEVDEKPEGGGGWFSKCSIV